MKIDNTKKMSELILQWEEEQIWRSAGKNGREVSSHEVNQEALDKIHHMTAYELLESMEWIMELRAEQAKNFKIEFNKLFNLLSREVEGTLYPKFRLIEQRRKEVGDTEEVLEMIKLEIRLLGLEE